MARLPTPGGDDGTWGNILNDYLLVSHTEGGELKDDAVSSDTLQDGSITTAKLANDSVTEPKLGTSNSPTSGDILAYSGTSLEWQSTSAHTHDDQYYTETEIDTRIAPQIIAGRWQGIPLRTGSYPNDTNLGNGVLVLWPMPVSKATSVDAMGTYVTIAGDATAVIRFGIYSSTGLIADVGTVSAATTGEKSLTFSPVSLPAGIIWMGAVIQGVTVTAPQLRGVEGFDVLRWMPHTSANHATDFSATCSKTTGVTGALPNTAPTLGILDWTDHAPVLAARWA